MAHEDPVLRALCRELTPWQQVELIASRQARAISTAQVHACGVSRRAMRTAIDRRHLNRVHRGVLAAGIRNLDAAGRRWAAYLAAGPDTALAGQTGAALAGLRPEVHTIHLAAPVPRRDHDGVRVHHLEGLCDAWIRRRDRLPVLRPEHVMLDLATDLDAGALAIALNQGLSLRAFTTDDLLAAIAARSGHVGRGRLAAAVAEAVDDPGAGGTHGELEALALPLIRALPGLPQYRRNELIELANGRLAKADVYFPGPRVMLELDSRTWHEQRLAMDDDRRRDQQALAIGVVVFRITWRHVTREWDDVSGDLLALLATRGGTATDEVAA